MRWTRTPWLALALGALAPSEAAWAGSERLVLPDGRSVAGRLVGDAEAGFAFRPEDGGPNLPLSAAVAIEATPEPPGPDAGRPPVRLRLGPEGRLSGRVESIDADAIHFRPAAGGPALRIDRAGLVGLTRRVGEVEVLHEGFETLDPRRWPSPVGEAEIDAAIHLEGRRAPRLPAGGAAVTHRLAEPVGAGRLELAFHDPGGRAEGHAAFVDLSFAGPAGVRASIRVLVGWDEEALAVESFDGPRLQVQRLARRAGWRRLVVRFGPEETALLVDGDELAHGQPPAGPLVEVRLATSGRGGSPAPEGLALVVDDLTLSRSVEPAGSVEVEPSLDELRLISGDQLFGRLESADAERVRLAVDGRTLDLAWPGIFAVRFRREAVPARPIEGELVRVDWRAEPAGGTREPDRVEGALRAASDDAIELDVPYAGRVSIPRASLIRLVPLGQARRVVLDAFPRHLGDRYDPSFEPPQPEPEPCTYSLRLDDPPDGPAALRLDVVGVIGESGTPVFSDQVRRGAYRTTVVLNGRELGDLNPLIADGNETPARVGLAIPPGLLRAGRNELKLIQVGTREDPSRRDNLGVLGVALETPADAPGGAVRP